MPLCKAKIAQEYDRRQIQVGDTFEVEQRHVLFLTALGRIERVEDQTYATRDMAAPTNIGTRSMTAAPRGKRAHAGKAA